MRLDAPSRLPVTVVVGTHTERRWPQLMQALDSAQAQVPAPERVVVVVDHNEALRTRLQRERPDVTVLANRHERGASGTRNTGAEASTTPFVAFLDDDARARASWLEHLLAPLDVPEVVGVGGAVVPLWEHSRPRWFPDEFGWVVGVSYRGQPERQQPVRNVWSENMAVRREAFEAVGGFRLGFGKVGDRSRPEDTDLCIRMTDASGGGRWIYAPQAVVDHHVPGDRSSFSFFLRRCYAEGRGKVEMAGLLAGEDRLDAERDYLRKVLPLGVVRGLRPGGNAGAHGPERSGAILAGAGAAGVGAASALAERSLHRRRARLARASR